MKKNLLFLLVIFILPMVGSTQIWEDNFDGSDISAWTLNDVDGDGLEWSHSVGFGINGGDCITSASWTQANGPVNPNNYISTPTIDLTAVAGAVALDWKAYAQDQAWPMEKYKVIASEGTDVASIDAGDVLFEETLMATGAQVWVERTVDLSAYAGRSINLTFVHYESSDWFRVNIDDVSVYQPASDDAGITGALAPSNNNGCTFTDAETPTITLFNFGGNAITGFDVSYSVNGGAAVVETVAASIAPATSMDYTFTTPFDASALGDYTVDFSTALNGDSNTSNDTYSESFSHTDAVMTIHVQTDVSGPHAWEVVDNETGEVVASHGNYSWDEEFFDDVCIYSDRCYSFAFAHGGGMGPGTFLEILVDGVNVAGDANGDGVASQIQYPILGGGCAAIDASLIGITNPRYHAIDSDVNINGFVRNLGTTTIESLQMSYTVNGGTPVMQDFTGLSAASGDFYEFTFTSPVNMADFDVRNVDIAVMTVNGETEEASNNTGNVTLEAVSFIPRKATIAEEATGTWCQWCPRGDVLLERMSQEFGDEFIGIAVHNGDPMVLTEYDDGIGNYIAGYPSIVLDRVNSDADPGSISDAALNQMRADIQARLDEVALMSIDVDVSYVGDGTMTIELSSEFVAPVSGALRYNVIITEDGVTGTSNGYAQVNQYSGGASGPMDGYENLPNPVPASQMVYDHVAIDMLGGFNGQIGSIPTTNQRGDMVSYTFTYDVDITKLDRLHVVAFIIDQTNGSIVNAISTSLFTTDTKDVLLEESAVKVFPNPSQGISFVQVNLSEATDVEMSIFNNVGQLVDKRNYGKLNGEMVLPIQSQNYEDGIYYIHVRLDDKVTTKKLILTK